MNAQSVMMDARVAHVRELKAEVARLKEENARLRDASETLASHIGLAALALDDARRLGGGRMIVVDGWNAILGAQKTARDRQDLEGQMRGHLAAHPDDFVWIVYDGPRFASTLEGRLRVSYTGGTGAHRADRFVCDFLRAARWAGVRDRIDVRTADRDFLRETTRI